MATAQVLYAMTGCMEDVAQAYVRQQRVRAIVANPWLDKGFASACAGIEEAERERLLAPVTPEGLRAVAAARQYLVEHGLVQWVAHQNVKQRHSSHSSSCGARVGDPLGTARLGDPLGAAGLENGQA